MLTKLETSIAWCRWNDSILPLNGPFYPILLPDREREGIQCMWREDAYLSSRGRTRIPTRMESIKAKKSSRGRVVFKFPRARDNLKPANQNWLISHSDHALTTPPIMAARSSLRLLSARRALPPLCTTNSAAHRSRRFPSTSKPASPLLSNCLNYTTVSILVSVHVIFAAVYLRRATSEMVV